MKHTKADEKVLLELLEQGIVEKKQLKEMLQERRNSTVSLGRFLFEKNILSQKQFIRILQSKLGIAYANLNIFIMDPHITRLVSRNICNEFKLFPLLKVKNSLYVAMADPLDSSVIRNIEESTGCHIRPLVSTESEIMQTIVQYYDNWQPHSSKSVKDEILGLEIFDQAAKLSIEIEKSFQELSNEKSIGDERTVSRLVNITIMKAVQVKASDIHIEPQQEDIRIRFRVDGILHEVMSLSDEIKDNLASRVKIMAELDIAEKRAPQDGRITLSKAGKNVDIRVSTYPSIFGEKIVLRILDKTSALISLEEAGFNKVNLDHFKEIIHKPNGIILVTGPTGSGKTSTLYAALTEINSMDTNVITIEDPVEYHIPHITQAQIHPKAGFTFAAGLRSILRQDPNIIMVGEIRDLETAETAIRAALTGHLVFSTLHTNDSAGAMTRLVDMGVEPFLVSSSIIGVLAQRLVRKICPYCKVKARSNPVLYRQMELDTKEEFFEGRGCQACNFTGYIGRTGLFEFLLPTDEVRKLVIFKESSSTIKKQAVKDGMVTLRQDGISKAREGMTTLDEVIRVTYG
ncbi:MAG: ATPase, T2SS/T4P/T4SS family [Candidatus Wallbacteria bacterium]|nr:ATPase, T2SS/T4P/T4SS family [Candidatus Wallbacteria bacterium]